MIARQGWIVSTPVAAGQETTDMACPWRVLGVDVYGVHANTYVAPPARPPGWFGSKIGAPSVVAVAVAVVVCGGSHVDAMCDIRKPRGIQVG
jgi:hypothetical protein